MFVSGCQIMSTGHNAGGILAGCPLENLEAFHCTFTPGIDMLLPVLFCVNRATSQN
jgi:hypothetical protein